MKMMFQTLVNCTTELINLLQQHADKQKTVDIKEIVARFTTDVIGSCAFGIDCNSLKNPNSEFRKYGKRVFDPPQSIMNRIRGILFILLPKQILNALQMKQFNRETEAFFMEMVKNTVNYREKNNVDRNDFMQLLLQLRNDGKVKDYLGDTETNSKYSLPGQTLTMDELAAQCFVFFVAGFETSATTMTFAFLELALNQEIQNKLREEIEAVLQKHNGNLTYEAVMEMTYLDKVERGK